MDLELFGKLQCSEETLKKFDIQAKDKRELISMINENIFKKCAKNSKERYEVLDLRDKVLKLIRYEIGLIKSSTTSSLAQGSNSTKQKQPTVQNDLNGTCQDMCPEKERYSRDYLSLSHKYEMFYNEQENKDVVNHNLMIKEYSRSSADQDWPLPSEMRPLSVLYDTMNYLINDIIPQLIDFDSVNDQSIGFWYDFVWNRTRAIRKDIIQQRLLLSNEHSSSTSEQIAFDVNEENQIASGVGIIEQCARFHIMCAYRLCLQSPEVFDFKINEENLKNCFQSLRQYYENSNAHSHNTNLKPSPNEAEFRAYVILLNLNESNILCAIQRWPEHIRHSAPVRFALKVYFAYNAKNYIRFFRLIQSDECQYLQACILHRYFFRMRSDAFRSIFSAFKENKEKVYPLVKLKECLAFDRIEDVYDYCEQFELEISDENNAIMRHSNFSCFKVSKPVEDRLKLQHSNLLVDAKFFRLANETQMDFKDCISVIISGNAMIVPSRFGLNHELFSSFDVEGFYRNHDINQFLYKLRDLQPLFEIKRPQLKSIQPDHSQSAAKIKIAAASNLVKKAAAQKSAKTQEKSPTLGLPNGGVKERRKSTSSNSSSEMKEVKAKKPVIAEQKRLSQENKPFPIAGGNLFQRSIEKVVPNKPFDSKLTAATTEPTFSTLRPTESSSSLFKFPAKQPQIQQPVFGSSSNLQQGVSTTPLFSFNKFTQPPTQDTTAPKMFGLSAKESSNLFEKIVKRQPTQPSFQVEPKAQQSELVQQQQQQLEANKLKEQLSETLFQSIYLEIAQELAKDMANNFLFAQKTLSTETLSFIVDSVCQLEIRRVIDEVIQEMVRIRKELELNIRLQQINYLSELVCDDLVKELVVLNCRQVLEESLYEQLLSDVFKTQFEHIIKETAKEMNEEIMLDKLAENIYLYYNENISLDDENDSFQMVEMDDSGAGTTSDNVNPNSMFMNDLKSFLHECIYESTRLNLNVNRELYFELKQSLMLNERLHIFRTWRLKLSTKLLYKAHRRLSANLKNRDSQIEAKSNNGQVCVDSTQLNLIAFMQSYSTYLLTNSNRFQKLHSFLVSNSYYAFDDHDKKRKGSSPINYSIVHSDEYQMHLTWDFPLNFKFYFYDLLFVNYFNIVHSNDEDVFLSPCISSPLTTPSDSSAQPQINEIYLKSVLVMPFYDQDDENNKAIERWLMSKFFDFNSKTNSYQTTCLESFCLNALQSNQYGVKFCLKFFKTNLKRAEYEIKASKRSLYGANSMLFVLMPFDETNWETYLAENRRHFHETLKLFNENVQVDTIKAKVHFMFISYLSDQTQTETVIRHLFDKKSVDELDNCCYCLLEGDVVKDNGLLQQTYQYFLHRSTLDYSKSANSTLSKINHVASLSEIIDMSLMKFLEFLTSHQSVSTSIHLSFGSLIKEFNLRLNKLVEMLTRDEYRQVAWPVIPEFLNSEIKAEPAKWTLRYWNSSECFDQVLRKQFLGLLRLIDDDEETRHLEQAEDNLDQVRNSLYNYLNRLLSFKTVSKQFPCQAECVKTIYELESHIQIEIERMNAKQRQSRTKRVEWARLFLPIIGYLLSNGFLAFQNKKKIYLNQFYVYFNLNEFRQYDWVNNRRSADAPSPADLLRKYAKQQQEVELQVAPNLLKRRYSDDNSENSDEESAEESKAALSPSELSKKMDLIAKHQRLAFSPARLVADESQREMNSLDKRFKDFLELLNKEKCEHEKFQSELEKQVERTECVKTNFEKKSDESIPFAFDNRQEKKESTDNFNAKQMVVGEPTLLNDINNLLAKLSEEKIKNEKFNLQLEKEMLNC